jgi:large subunit ribosomal protein L10
MKGGISMNKNVLAAKKETVSEIEKNLKDCGSLTIVSYQGLTVSELTELRKQLSTKNSNLSVYKNTLVGRALKENGETGLESYLEGPNAFVFSKEITDGPSILRKFGRFHEKLVIKGGYVDGKAYDGKAMLDIAKMPNKEGLLSMFCQCLNAPIRSFAVAVNAIASKAPAAAPAAPAAAK